MFTKNYLKLISFLFWQCKNVISKLQRRIDKEGHEIVPLLTDLWKRIENSGNSLLDLRKIDQRIDKFEYNGATELVFDVQFMLKSAMHFYGFSHEVRFLTCICTTLAFRWRLLHLGQSVP